MKKTLLLIAILNLCILENAPTEQLKPIEFPEGTCGTPEFHSLKVMLSRSYEPGVREGPIKTSDALGDEQSFWIQEQTTSTT